MDTSKWNAAVKLITERLGEGGKIHVFDMGFRWECSFSLMRYFPSPSLANDALLEWATVATSCSTTFTYHVYQPDEYGQQEVSLSIHVGREATDDEVEEAKARTAEAQARKAPAPAVIEGSPV